MRLGRGRPLAGFAWTPFLGLMLVALTLRGPIVAPAPVIGEIRLDTGMGVASAGLLASIPVLCFGVFAPAAAWLINRFGMDLAVIASMIGAALGILIRPWGGSGLLLAGSTVLGISLSIGNVVALMVIRTDLFAYAAPVTSAYTAALNVGTMLTSASTAPLAAVLGWRVALASGAILALAAAGLWIRVALARRQVTPLASAESLPGTETLSSAETLPRSGEEKPGRTSGLWRKPLVWVLTLSMVVHLFVYYAITAWLPEYLSDAVGMTPSAAGGAASLIQVLAILGAFVAAPLVRRAGAGLTLAILGACWAITPLGLLLTPSWWPFWSLLGAMAQGGLFSALFILIVARASNARESGAMSAAVQGFGYALASIGPVFMGHQREVTGGWSSGMLTLSALALVIVVVGIAFAFSDRRDAGRPSGR